MRDGAPPTGEDLTDDLLRRAARSGIDAQYDDIWGERHIVPAASLHALLRETGSEPEGGPDKAFAALPPILFQKEGMPSLIVGVWLPVDLPLIQWRLVEEGDVVHAGAIDARLLMRSEPRMVNGVLLALFDLVIDVALPLGYHRLEVTGAAGNTQVVCAPPRCYEPPALASDGRLWGVALQLYGLRSPRNWGIGDFTDLAGFSENAARQGASVIGLNPLHALFPHNPSHASPYSPSSRAQLNVLYIDVEAVPDFDACDEARTTVRSPEFQARLAALRAEPLVNYSGVASAKHEVLAQLHAHFLTRSNFDPEVQAFRLFQQQGGQALHQHAVFEAVQAHFHQGDSNIWGWPAWPQEWRDSSSPQLALFIAEHAQRIAFFEYLQWQAARQLESVGNLCKAQGMPIGLYLDLAVSVDRGGSDTWRHQGTFALGASVGAPPDFHNREGQDWGLPPLRPDRLRESRYAVFIEALRANMRGAGALRIDHVMMLMRLFWIPPGGKARDGAYVHYPYEELFAILALESCRQHCLVVGEDLGTVPDAMREAMRRYGVLSYRLLYFEHTDAGDFRAPADYPRDAVVAVSTHDLPTLAGWWTGADLSARMELGLYAEATAHDLHRSEREAERPRLINALRHHAPENTDHLHSPAQDRLTPGLAAAIHGYLAAAPSSIMMLQLEDMLEQPRQVNIPGTTIEHPNWQRKYTHDVEALWRTPLARQISSTIARIRPRADFIADAQDKGTPRTKIPRATYRLQLHKGFTFDNAVRVVPYLAQLGISHVYCSPIHRARPGSMHGYDVVAHDEINPELGGMPAFERFTMALRAHGMGQLIDLVPNHMGVLGGDNAWWNDLLEHGAASPYARHFDIDWESATPGLAGKVLLAVLGDHYGQVLARGELQVQWDATVRKPVLRYFEHAYPLARHTLPDALRHVDGNDLAAVESALAPFAGPDGHDALHALLEAQAYRLAYWRTAADEINYRRFFDVNELAALRTEREDVFEATHAMALDLAARGWVEGLRIDHPDGLLDPATYFERLQSGYASRVRTATWGFDEAADTTGRPLYVVAEKIASPHEDVPLSWPIHGTTGYRFANVANGVLVDHRAAGRITGIWQAFTGNHQEFAQVVYEAKQSVARGPLASDLEVLASALLKVAKQGRGTRDYTLNTLREVIAAVAACLSVYRTYNGDDATPQDVRLVDEAIEAARERLQLPDPSVFAFVRDALLGQPAPDSDAALQSAVRQFARRFQQYSAPVAAKGVEDTAFYRYLPLSALNEVGGEPDRIGMSVEQFHEASSDRQQRWPHTMLATSTHDNKRSEDVRLRIDVLTELPEWWERSLKQWKRLNAPLRGPVLATHEYLLYQTLLGTLATEPMDAAQAQDYAQRIVQYMIKAAREGKTGTSWTRPDDAYESALEHFVRSVLAPSPDNAFVADLRTFAERLDRYGALNGLSLALLKFTSPGVPDIYQGCELIDRSLVDPDNRRAVDYGERQHALQALQALGAAGDVEAEVRSLVANATNGHAKLWTVWRLLALRSQRPEFFRDATYEPLEVLGSGREHLLASVRRHEGSVLVVIAMRLYARFERKHGTLDAPRWKDTRVLLPAELDGRISQDHITGARFKLAREIYAADLLAVYPGAVLLVEG